MQHRGCPGLLIWQGHSDVFVNSSRWVLYCSHTVPTVWGHQFEVATTPSLGIYPLLHPFSASPGLVAMWQHERTLKEGLAGLCPFPGMRTALAVPDSAGGLRLPHTPCHFVPEPLSML